MDRMEPGALLFVTFVAIVGFGLLWFRVQEFRGRKPQLPDMWTVKPSLEQRFEIMSRTPDPVASEPASDLRQTVSQTDQTAPAAPKPQPATLDTCKSLRAHGYTREEARAFLRGVDRTLDNNVWAAAQPPAPADDDLIVTPYAGRVTRKSYYTDADFPYEEPKV